MCKATDPKTYTVSTKYNDSDADLVIITEDNGRLRVHSYILKIHSSVLRDMLNKPLLSPSITSDAHVIQLDTTLVIAELLFDLCTKRDKDYKATWAEMKAAFAISERFDFGVVSDRIARQGHDYLTTDSWRVFVFASHRDDFAIAKRAIAHFGRKGGRRWTPSRVPSATELQQLVPIYAYMLGQCLREEGVFSDPEWGWSAHWDIAAGAFKLPPISEQA